MNDSLLDIRQLEAFAAVMSAGSITGAARLLGKSQPVVTRLIQDLETDVGFALLHRSGPRIAPTDKGVSFHGEIERLLIGLRHIRERATAIATSGSAPIEVVATQTLAGGLLPMALAGLAPRDMPARVHLRSSSAEQVVQSILARTADIGVASLPIDHPGLEIHWIGEAPCVAVMSATNDLAPNGILPLAALTGQRIITMANPYRLRRRIDLALAAANVGPADLIETNASLNAVMSARAGLGVALVDPATAFGIPVEGVVVRAIDAHIPFVFGTVTSAGMPVSHAVRSLIDQIRVSAAHLLPGFVCRTSVELDSLSDTLYGPNTPQSGRFVSEAT